MRGNIMEYPTVISTEILKCCNNQSEDALIQCEAVRVSPSFLNLDFTINIAMIYAFINNKHPAELLHIWSQLKINNEELEVSLFSNNFEGSEFFCEVKTIGMNCPDGFSLLDNFIFGNGENAVRCLALVPVVSD